MRNPALPTTLGTESLDELIVAGPPKGAVRGMVFSVRAIFERRELLGLLIRREIKSRYKDSSLGFAWSLVRPLTMFVIYYVAVGQFLHAAQSIPSFAIYVFAGLTAWGLFNDIVAGATGSIVGNAALIKKVYLPREIFPVSAVGSAGFNFLIQLGILVLATIALGQFPWSPNLLLLPLAVIALVLFALAIGLLLSALNVYLRDVGHLVEVLLMVLFWGSPIVYSYRLLDTAIAHIWGGWLVQLYLLNPVTLIVLGFQKSMWIAGAGEPWPVGLEWRLVAVAAFSLLLLWFAQRVFARLEGNFAQEI